MENYDCKRLNYIKCCLTDCASTRNDVIRRTFFAFPKDPTRCTVWLENCGLDHLKTVDPMILNKKYRICSLHFKDSMFSNYQKNRLFPNASPTPCKKQIIKSNLVQIKDDQSRSPNIINAKSSEVNQIKPFQEIVKNVGLLSIPSKWHRNFSRANKKMIIAFHKLGSYKENYMRFIEKQLILTEEFHLLLYIYDKQIEISDIGYPLDMEVKTCKDLENVIVKFDRV